MIGLDVRRAAGLLPTALIGQRARKQSQQLNLSTLSLYCKPNRTIALHPTPPQGDAMEPEPYDTYPNEFYAEEDGDNDRYNEVNQEVAHHLAFPGCANGVQFESANGVQFAAHHVNTGYEGMGDVQPVEKPLGLLRKNGINRMELDRIVFRIVKRLKRRYAEIPHIDVQQAEYDAVPLLVDGMEFNDFNWTFRQKWPLAEDDYGIEKLEGTLEDAKMDCTSDPKLPKMVRKGVVRLALLCSKLQADKGKNPFHLDQRQAGVLLGVDRTNVGRWIKQLLAMKVLVRTYEGHTNRASEYLYVGDMAHIPSFLRSTKTA